MLDVPKIRIQLPGGQASDRGFPVKPKFHFTPEPCQFEMPKKVLLLANLQGNFERLYQFLLSSKVINSNFEWIFDEGHLVVTGDTIAFDHSGLECLWLLYSLEERAKREGGCVHLLLGEREINGLFAAWPTQHPNYGLNSSTAKGSYTALYLGNAELLRWLLTKNFVTRIGNVLLIGGGFSLRILDRHYSLFEINRMMRDHLKMGRLSMSENEWSSLFTNDLYIPHNAEQITEVSAFVCKILDLHSVATIVSASNTTAKVSIEAVPHILNIKTDHSQPTSEGLYIYKGAYFRVNEKGKHAVLKMEHSD